MITRTTSRPPNLLRYAGWGLLASLLLVPAIAMQFSPEVDWGPGDFVVMAGLFALLGLSVEYVVARYSAGRRVAAVIATITIALLVWAELAVGLVD